MPRHNRRQMTRRKRRELAVRRDNLKAARSEDKAKRRVKRQHRGGTARRDEGKQLNEHGAGTLLSDYFPRGGLK